MLMYFDMGPRESRAGMPTGRGGAGRPRLGGLSGARRPTGRPTARRAWPPACPRTRPARPAGCAHGPRGRPGVFVPEIVGALGARASAGGSPVRPGLHGDGDRGVQCDAARLDVAVQERAGCREVGCRRRRRRARQGRLNGGDGQGRRACKAPGEGAGTHAGRGPAPVGSRGVYFGHPGRRTVRCEARQAAATSSVPGIKPAMRLCRSGRGFRRTAATPTTQRAPVRLKTAERKF